MLEAVQGTILAVGERGLDVGVGLGVGVEAASSVARFSARFWSLFSFQRARFSSKERLAIGGRGEGVGEGSAGFSIRVEGVGRGLGGVSGVVGASVLGTGVSGRWVGGWGVGFGWFRLLLGLRCFLVGGVVGVVVGMLEETFSTSVFFAMGLGRVVVLVRMREETISESVFFVMGLEGGL